MSRLASIFAFCLVSILLVIVSSAYLTFQSINGNDRIPDYVKSCILYCAMLPRYIKGVLLLPIDRIKPPGVFDKYSGFVPTEHQACNVDGKILISYINSEGDNVVILQNPESNFGKTVFHQKWNTKIAAYSDSLGDLGDFRQSAVSSQNQIHHPYLSPSGIMTYLIPGNDLVSFDVKAKREVWRIKGVFHHSIEPDVNGNLWTCGEVKPPQGFPYFRDQVLVRFSTSGKIQKVISVAKLLSDNGFDFMLYGMARLEVNMDPFHLNRVSPITQDLGVMKVGDLLVSCRNLSTVFLVDPDKETIKWYRSGPWINQHCVKPYEDSVISIFDNHCFATGEIPWVKGEWGSRIVLCNMRTGDVSVVPLSLNPAPPLRLRYGGQGFSLGYSKWLVEDNACGTVLIFDGKNLVYKWSNLYPNGKVGPTSWVRYISNGQIPDFLR